jgi:iron complex outermembrane recepter protein
MRRKSLILGSTSLAVLALVATPAAAQDEPAPDEAAQQEAQTGPAETADPTQGDESIVVTGLRRSLQSAQNIRRNSDQIVDAIVAEDIGKLPDLNTAQTAARIPGVQVYRQGGEAQNVLVRGLPNFTTTYNGREIFTAETRVVALQDFPSANVAALEVFKTSTADLVGPGLAGLVNVRSRRPFDFSGGQFAGSVWGLYTVQGHEVTPNFNLLATRRWDTDAGEFGILLNVSYTDMVYLDSEISNTDFIAPGPSGSRFPDIQRLFYRSGQRIRPSANAAAQWRPNQDLEFYFDFLWQGFRNRIDDRLLAATLFGGTYTNLVFREGTDLLSSGTVTNPGGSLFSFQGGTYNRTNTFQYAGGIRFNPGRLHFNVDVARTTSTFRGSTESVDRIWPGPRTVNFDNEEPSFEITGINFADPAAQIFEGLFEENQRSAGQDWQVRADAQYDFDTAFLQNIQIGARYTNRDAQRLYANRFAFLTPLGIPASTLPLDFEVFRGVPRSNGTFNWSAPTYDSIRDRIVELRQLIITRCPEILVTDPNNGCQNYTTAPVTPNTLFTAEEETLAGYAQASLGNDDLNGIIGVRVEHIETRVAGPQPTGIPIIDEGSEDTVILPNASVRARVADRFQVRAAVSKTITRPNFTDLVPSIVLGPPPPGGIGTDSDPRRGTGGNPFLVPFTSWNYDASVEYYFARAGFASVSVFHRDIDGFIQQSTFRFNDPTLGVVEITGPVNTGRGRITGAEAQFQTFFDFDFVPDWARGFGVQANVTYLDAETEQPNGQGGLAFFPITDQLNGVSKWNYNLVGMYERYGLSARLSFNGRSSYSATRQFRGNDLYLETARPADRLDLSLNYNLLENLTIFGDWTNITRTPFRQDFSSARDGAARAEYIRFLRFDESTLSLGVRFRFGG